MQVVIRVGPVGLVPIGFVPLMCYSDAYSLIDMACTTVYVILIDYAILYELCYLNCEAESQLLMLL